MNTGSAGVKPLGHGGKVGRPTPFSRMRGPEIHLRRPALRVDVSRPASQPGPSR